MRFAEINSFIIYPEVPEDIRHFYFEKLARWRDAGVKFTYGSDLHGAEYNFEFKATFEKLLMQYGFSAGDFALPKSLKKARNILKKQRQCKFPKDINYIEYSLQKLNRRLQRLPAV